MRPLLQLFVHCTLLFMINTVGDMSVFQTLGFNIKEAGCFCIIILIPNQRTSQSADTCIYLSTLHLLGSTAIHPFITLPRSSRNELPVISQSPSFVYHRTKKLHLYSCFCSVFLSCSRFTHTHTHTHTKHVLINIFISSSPSIIHSPCHAMPVKPQIVH